MADLSVPSIATAVPTTGDTVLGVKGGVVKRFAMESFVGPPGASVAGTSYSAATIAAAKALVGVPVGAQVYIADQGEMFVVRSGTVGDNGLTTFFFDEDVSAEQTWVPATNFFSAATYANNYPAQLPHTKFKLESISVVVTDGGEAIPALYMHGHQMSPGRAIAPQIPSFDLALGRMFDPNGVMTYQVSQRTGGFQVKYKYNTGTRYLQRIHGPAWHVRWLPTEADSTNWLAWMLNFMATSGAEELRFDRLVPYTRTIEIPTGLRLVGHDYRTCGLRVPDGKMMDSFLLSKSTVPGDTSIYPMNSPNTRLDKWLASTYCYAPMVAPATAGRGFSLKDIRIDGNIANQMQPWINPELYAWGYIGSSYVFRDSPVASGVAFTNHGGRTISPGCELHIDGTVFIGDFAAACLLGHSNSWCFNHGKLIIGSSSDNHQIYFMHVTGGDMEVRGFANGDGLRVYHVDVDRIKFVPTRHPDARFTNNALIHVAKREAQLLNDAMSLVSFVGSNLPPNMQAQETAAGYTAPIGKFHVGSIQIDAMAMDNVPAGLSAQVLARPFLLAGDNVRIGQMNIRGGVNFYHGRLISTSGNGLQHGPYTNWLIENVQYEIAAANKNSQGTCLFQDNNPSSGMMSMTMRNISVLHLGATGTLNEWANNGEGPLLGQFRFDVPPDYENEGSYELEFAGQTGASMAGKYFSITPAGVGSPTATVWYSVGGVGTAPGGSNPINVDVLSGDSAASIVTKTRIAIWANATIKPWLVVREKDERANSGSVLIIGQQTNYRVEGKIGITFTPSAIAGVTFTHRTNARFLQPHVLNFENILAPANNSLCLMTVAPIGAGHGRVQFNFNKCTFGAWRGSAIFNAANQGYKSLWTAETLASIGFQFVDCELAMANRGENFYADNYEVILHHAKHRNTRFLREDKTYLYSDQSVNHTFTSTGAETSFDMTALKMVSTPREWQLIPLNANARAIVASATQEWRDAAGSAITPTPFGELLAINPRLRVSGFTALAAGQTATFRYTGKLNP